jgi:hypothetical protein
MKLAVLKPNFLGLINQALARVEKGLESIFRNLQFEGLFGKLVPSGLELPHPPIAIPFLGLALFLESLDFELP